MAESYRVTIWTIKGTQVWIDMNSADVVRFVEGLKTGSNQFLQQNGATFPGNYVPFHAIDNVTIEKQEPSTDG